MLISHSLGVTHWRIFILTNHKRITGNNFQSMVDLRDLCMTSKVDNYSADHTLGLQALHLQLLNI